jgi:transcriptional regulator with XRE-family HTH domain
MTTWANRIRDLRELGMTLAEIGTEIGIATSSVSDIATGRTKEPGGDAALKLHSLHLVRCAKPVRTSA